MLTLSLRSSTFTEGTGRADTDTGKNQLATIEKNRRLREKIYCRSAKRLCKVGITSSKFGMSGMVQQTEYLVKEGKKMFSLFFPT